MHTQDNPIDVLFLSTASRTENVLGEAGRSFTDGVDSQWKSGRFFDDTDVGSGVGCAFDGTHMRMYFRNLSTGNLHAQSWDYTPSLPDVQWLQGKDA